MQRQTRKMLTKSISTRKFLIAVVVVLLAYVYNTRNGYDSPIVETKLGKVQGFSAWSRGNREFYKYLGIPYAKPPVGELRFEPPQSPEKWEGIRHAGKFGSPCVQVNFFASIFMGQEDCLYLNVYTPKHTQPAKLLPVIFWIYGGMFMEGMTDYYGPDFLMDEDIVLVTINYRVGALGFLNTGDNVVRGNMGLKDQNFALRWVQQNIKGFGGNPGQVTLAGQSAGGASVHYHMLSPLSKGLFHKGISASGVAVSPWSFNNYPLQQAIRFARPLCPTGNTSEMVACLKLLPIRTIQDAHLEVCDLLRDTLSVFVPTAEAVNDSNAFLATDPIEVAKTGGVSKVPWLLGVTSHEGFMFTAMTLTNETLVDAAINRWQYLLPRTMYFREDLDMETIVRIKEQYFGNATELTVESTEQIENFTNVFSDRHFFAGIQDAATLHRKYSPLYLYYMTHRPKYSIANLLLARNGVVHPFLDFAVHIVGRWFQEKVLGIKIQNNRTSHIDDLGLIFNLGIPGQIYDEDETEMSKRMIKMYASFASKDNSDKMDFAGVEWPPLDPKQDASQKRKYMELTLNPALIDEPFTDRVNFWKSIDVS